MDWKSACQAGGCIPVKKDYNVRDIPWLVSRSVFSHVSVSREVAVEEGQRTPRRVYSPVLLIFFNTLELRYKQPKVMTIPLRLGPSELGADCKLQSQNAAFFVKQVNGELNSAGVTEWRTDPRSFTPVRTRAVGKRFIVHLSNRIGGPNLLN